MGSDPINISGGGGESAQRYAARMVYLTEEDDGNLFGGATPEPMGRTLKPPVLFMSRRQARADSALCANRATKRTITEADPLRGVRGAPTGEKKPLVTRRNDATARANKRKSENKRETRNQAGYSPEDEPANWRRMKEAGVLFWVNDVTGVATDECPHESLRPPEADLKKRSMSEACAGDEGAWARRSVDLDIGFEGQEEGTGALVYDSSEFEQAMRLLDGGSTRQPSPSRPK